MCVQYSGSVSSSESDEICTDTPQSRIETLLWPLRYSTWVRIYDLLEMYVSPYQWTLCSLVHFDTTLFVEWNISANMHPVSIEDNLAPVGGTTICTFFKGDDLLEIHWNESISPVISCYRHLGSAHTTRGQTMSISGIDKAREVLAVFLS